MTGSSPVISTKKASANADAFFFVEIYQFFITCLRHDALKGVCYLR